MKAHTAILTAFVLLCIFSCKKKDNTVAPPVQPAGPLNVTAVYVNNTAFTSALAGVSNPPVIKVQFSVALLTSSVAGAVNITDAATGTAVAITTSFQNGDSVLLVQPAAALKYLNQYIFNIGTALHSSGGVALGTAFSKIFYTQIDSSRKFPLLSDNDLLDTIQRKTFTYFWDFGHPVSGLARERNTSGETVTAGGSGFGIMAIVTAVSRNYITRAQGLARLQTIVSFLKNTAQKFHGAFPHWLNGTSGVVIPFSANDDGADLVETSYLMQGLLCARQFFNSGTDAGEISLRNNINNLWNA